MTMTEYKTRKAELARLLYDRFRGRPYPITKNGRPDYRGGPLSPERIEREHLTGEAALGVYPTMAKDDDRVVWSCVDIDNHGGENPQWREQATTVADYVDKFGLDVLLEVSQSGIGGHVWIFFAEPVPSWLARRFWRAVESGIAGEVFHEINPKQNFASQCEKQLGNMVRIPLFNNSHFVDWADDWTERDPVDSLQNLEPIEPADFIELCATLGVDLSEPSQVSTVTNSTTSGADSDSAVQAAKPDEYVLSTCRDLFDNFARNWDEGFNAGDRSGPFFSVLTCLVKTCGQNRAQVERIVRTSHGWQTYLAEREGKNNRYLQQELDRAYAKMTNGQASKVVIAKRTADGRLRINADIQNLADVTGQGWRAIHEANDPPHLFRHGSSPVRIEFDDDGEPTFRTLGEDRMRHEVARVAQWYKVKSSGRGANRATFDVDAMPPRAVVLDMLATPNIDLPIVNRVVEAPVFTADGCLQLEPGYYPRGSVYYHPARGFTVPPVSERPTAADMAEARRLICDELLVDFPFVSDAERAHAVSLFLLPFARDLIDGPTPLHLFEKPSPGTGATLLVEMLAYPAIGRSIPVMTEAGRDEEWDKRIVAKLRNGPPFILIDNLRKRLDSSALSSAISSMSYEGRILGRSENARLPVRCCWIATGNNPALSSEIIRRTVRIRLDAKQDRPWLRTGFRHPQLRQWVKEHRPQLVWAALTLIRAWLVAGRPAGRSTKGTAIENTSAEIGSFDVWSKMIGGILNHAGIPGFLENMNEFYEQSDSEGEILRTFVGAWWEQFGDRSVGVAEMDKDLLGHECGAQIELDLGNGTHHV